MAKVTVIKGSSGVKRIPISRTQWLLIVNILLILGLYFK